MRTLPWLITAALLVLNAIQINHVAAYKAEREYREKTSEYRRVKRENIAAAEKEYKISQEEAAKKRDRAVENANLEYETGRQELKEARDNILGTLSGIQVIHIPKDPAVAAVAESEGTK